MRKQFIEIENGNREYIKETLQQPEQAADNSRRPPMQLENPHTPEAPDLGQAKKMRLC